MCCRRIPTTFFEAFQDSPRRYQIPWGKQIVMRNTCWLLVAKTVLNNREGEFLTFPQRLCTSASHCFPTVIHRGSGAGCFMTVLITLPRDCKGTSAPTGCRWGAPRCQIKVSGMKVGGRTKRRSVQEEHRSRRVRVLPPRYLFNGYRSLSRL